MADRIFTKTLMDSESISAGATAYSNKWSAQKTSGVFGIEVTVQGSGQVTIKQEATIDGTNYYVPSGAPDVVTDMTSSDGVDSNGIDIFQVDLFPALGGRLRVIETGAANSVTVTIKAVLQ